MQTFKLSKSARNQWLVFPAFFAIALLRSAGSLWARFENHTLGSSGLLPMFGIVVLALVIASVIFYLSVQVEYLVDDSEIVRKTKFNELRMTWREVERIEGGSTSFATVTLIDHRGRKLPISFANLENRGQGLRTIVDTQLERLLTRRQEEFKLQVRQQGAPSSSAGWVLCGIGGIFIVMSLALIVMQPMPGSPIIGGLIMLFGGLISFLGIYTGSRKILVTDDEVCAKWAFGETRMRFSEIESAYRYEASNNNGPYELLTVRGGKKKIVLGSSSLSDYGLVRDRILALVPETALASGGADREKLLAGQVKQVAVIVTVCCSFFFIGGLAVAKDVNSKIQFARSLQQRGIRVMATVTGDSCNCESERLTAIRFDYEVDGQRYESLNKTNAQTLGIKINDKVPAFYLPENPGRALLEPRLDWHPLLLDNAFLLAIAFATPLLIPIAIKGARNSMKQQPPQ